ncbi:MAG: hypothetical protein WBO07_01425 [Formosimonas sp.]|jgi:antitoxin ChpS
MKTVHIRKQGGAAIMTIPANFLKELHLDVGGLLELDVADGVLTAKPAVSRFRKRYSLQELLVNVTPEAMRELIEDTQWARDGETVGREL